MAESWETITNFTSYPSTEGNGRDLRLLTQTSGGII